MTTRKSIRDLSETEKRDLVDSLKILKHERIGPDRLSTYDRYVVQHNTAMMMTSAWQPGLDSTLLGRFRFTTQRNIAHRGPTFLPWHRVFLRRLELDIQRVLGNTDFGLPYWDWEHDGEMSRSDQTDVNNREIWQLVGGDGDPRFANMVTTGPFGFNPERLEDTTVFADPDIWLTVDTRGRRVGFLQRALGRGGRGEMRVFDMSTGEVRRDSSNQPIMTPLVLPTKNDIDLALSIPNYDVPNWDENRISITSFRNVLEGWTFSPYLHNRVHVWVGGSMGPGTSPNDPVFFLHHCNVDRIWAKWQEQHPSEGYKPVTNGPRDQNLHDPMFPWDGSQSNEAISPNDVWSQPDIEYATPPAS